MSVRKVNNNNVVVVHVILFNFNVRHCRVCTATTDDDDGGAQSAGVSADRPVDCAYYLFYCLLSVCCVE